MAMKRRRKWLSELKSEEFRTAFSKVHAVFGYDENRDKFILFFGRTAFEFTGSLRKEQALTAVVFEIDQRTDSLEFLAAACETLLGGCDYRGPKDFAP